jgi:hypothetical protein
MYFESNEFLYKIENKTIEKSFEWILYPGYSFSTFNKSFQRCLKVPLFIEELKRTFSEKENEIVSKSHAHAVSKYSKLF